MKTRIDLERYKQDLESMAAGVEYPAAGFFGPGSMVWRVNKEGGRALGVFRAVLLQIADSQAAGAGNDHGGFLVIPYERIARTFQTQQLIIFGSCDEAISVLTKFHGNQPQVGGRLSVGGRGAGEGALYPTRLLWVYGMLMDAFIRSHELFTQRLGFEEQERLYQECKLFAGLMGFVGDILPGDLLDFYDWISETLAGDNVQARLPAKEIAGALLRSPAPVFWPVNYILAAGLLPERLRAEYGLIWNSTLELLFNTGVGMIGQAAARLPLRMGAFGADRQARERTKA